MTHRGTTNRNDRGSAEARRARKAWLVETFGNDGIVVCYLCGLPMLSDEITVDRIVPGIEGGTYARTNIRPACGRCNSQTGQALGEARKRGRGQEAGAGT